MKELSFKQWHHGYLGLLLLLYGLLFHSLSFTIVGSLIVVDDLIEHSVQYLTQTEWQSPLRRVYSVVYNRVRLVRVVNAWLDGLFQ